MKTLKLLSVISFALMVFAASAIKPAEVSSMNTATPTPGNIKYQVTIHVPADLSLPNVHFFVVMTDGNGRRIAAPQQAVTGINTYYFSELGPVTGTRIARLVEAHISDSYMPFTCNPDVKTGIFKNGYMYDFNLWPSSSLPQ